ncbi:hypothetical protein CAEBREN_08436 [Caenorhabditis brenneri]|uniref:Uncharacterized protein n=1 Tax=Caenorhabditis brenneri TaxID=135651 RepID=G0M9W3_CAEBE|nr:hypothetical protein CAEBREN_08436 [Caenorhabditis brenneri]
MTKTYIVDAFTMERFKGNPAAVCLIPEVLPDETYLKIAAEFNLSETAFPVPLDSSADYKTCSKFSLRWFTPKTEFPLCGHATLATSHVLFNEIGNINNEIHYETLSGTLKVRKDENGNVEMNFPKYELVELEELGPQQGYPKIAAPEFLMDVIHCVVPKTIPIVSALYAPEARFLIVIIDPNTTRSEFEALKLNSSRALELHDGSFVRDMSITLRPKNPLEQGFVDPSEEAYDYTCRCFGPWDGVNEDPATGSAQCAMAPYWAKVTGKKELYAYQAFPTRGAQFRIRLQDDRVILNGSSVTVLRGELRL